MPTILPGQHEREVLAFGQWGQYQNSRPDQLLPMGYVSPPTLGGEATDFEQCINAWGDAIWDPVLQEYVFHGGGHGDSAMNGLFAFSRTIRSWRIMGENNDPVSFTRNPPLEELGPFDPWPDGNPISIHPFAGMVFVPGSPRYFYRSPGSAYPGGAPTQNYWRFPLPNGPWEILGPAPVSSNFFMHGMVYDPLSTAIYYIIDRSGSGSSGAFMFPIAGGPAGAVAYTNPNANPMGNLTYAGMGWDPVSRYLYAVRGHDTVTPTTSTKVYRAPLGGVPGTVIWEPITSLGDQTFWYDATVGANQPLVVADDGKLVIMPGTNSLSVRPTPNAIWAADLSTAPTLTWVKYSLTGDVPTPASAYKDPAMGFNTGAAHKIQLMEPGLMVYANSIAQHLFVLRLPWDQGNVPPSAPAVSNITPSSGEQGAVLPVSIGGANFITGATVSLGAGITISGVVVQSSTTITATATIAGGATPGLRDVTVTNPDLTFGVLSGGFLVTAPVPPILVNPVPQGTVLI
jgi:hypothetical protein